MKTWVLVLAAVASFMVALDALVVTTALSTIRRDLGASIEALEWVVNAYSLTFAVLLLPGAAIGDRFGRRRTFVAGLGLFVAASAACALAGGTGGLIAARAVQGAGAALVTPLAMALLSAAFPPNERAKALGIFSGLTGLALVMGPVVGGAIAEGLAWQWIFWLNVPIGLVLIPFVLARIPESFGPRAALDASGIGLGAGAAFALVWGLMRANDVGWTSAEVLYGAVFFMAQFLQTGQGYGPLAAGLRLVPWMATLFVVAPVAGALVNRIGERPLIVAGLLLQGVGLAWIALTAAPDAAYPGFVLPLIVAGVGVSMAMPAAQNAVVGSVALHEIGKASGTFSTSRYFGAVFGIAIAVAAFAGAGSFRSPAAFTTGFSWAVGASAVLALLGAVAGAWQPVRKRVLSAVAAST